MSKQYFVYITTNPNRSVLYIGVTNDLYRRIYEHKSKTVEGFTSDYNMHVLVYFEETEDIESAIAREKQLKRWSREKKEWLIAIKNPSWKDLFDFDRSGS